MQLNCEICGREPDDKWDLYYCEKCGHAICDGCMIMSSKISCYDKLQYAVKNILKKDFKDQKEVNKLQEMSEDDFNKWFEENYEPDCYEDETEFPFIMCPICRFDRISPEDLLKFLMREYEYWKSEEFWKAEDKLIEIIRDRFKTRSRFLRFLYKG